MGTWTEPSPSDWERWEAQLLAGAEPSSAAQSLGLTSTAFKRANRDRHADCLAMSREARGHFADERVEGWALHEDASDSMRQFWAKRWNPAYAGQRIEVTGVDGGPVRLEGRAVVGLADVVRLATELGVPLGLDARDTRGELPATRRVLPDPRDG